MTFTFEQLDALALGLSFVEIAGDTSLAEAAKEVRAKIQTALPEPDKRKLENAPLFASRRDGSAAPSAKMIRRAIRERNILRLIYEDAVGSSSDRRVRPLAIWAFTDGWLFAGWCELRNGFRAFRLDRITAIEETGCQFPDEPSRNLQAYLATKIFAVQTPNQKA